MKKAWSTSGLPAEFLKNLIEESIQETQNDWDGALNVCTTGLKAFEVE